MDSKLDLLVNRLFEPPTPQDRYYEQEFRQITSTPTRKTKRQDIKKTPNNRKITSPDNRYHNEQEQKYQSNQYGVFATQDDESTVMDHDPESPSDDISATSMLMLEGQTQ